MLLHYNDYIVLGLGRLISGIATSFLSTCFECYMVAEHNKRNFPGELLNNTFSAYIFLMGIVAIASGTIAGWAQTHYGMLGPFNVCAIAAVVEFLLIPLIW